MTTIAERESGSAPSDLPNCSYEWFARAKVPGRGVTIGLAPLEAVFESGIVTFQAGELIHDVGAGSGRSTEFILNQVPENIRFTISLIVSEPSHEQREELVKRVPGNTQIIEADALLALGLTHDIDKVFFVNAIHLLPENDRKEAINLAFNSLKTGGQFIISTTFFKGDIGREEQAAFMIPWMRAIKGMMTEEEKEEVARVGKTRTRMVKWPAERYLEEFKAAGFEVDFCRSDVLMPITEEGYEGISHYKLWNDEIIPGLDSERQIEIGTRAVRKVWFEDLNRGATDISARNTLVLVGRKSK